MRPVAALFLAYFLGQKILGMTDVDDPTNKAWYTRPLDPIRPEDKTGTCIMEDRPIGEGDKENRPRQVWLLLMERPLLGKHPSPSTDGLFLIDARLVMMFCLTGAQQLQSYRNSLRPLRPP